jgi:hypothetical protein
MRVLITGGTGLIGRALATHLTQHDHAVILLSRHPERATPPPDIRIARWDARTAAGWGELLETETPVGIVNLAGESLAAGRWTAARKRRIRQSRLDAGRAVVEAVEAAAHEPRVVIQASGSGYYGPRGDEVLTEDAGPGAGFLGRTAVAWERATQPVEALGVRRAVIRIGPVLSTQGGALPRMVLPFRLFAGGRLGDGQQWFPWIHITDAVRGIRFLLERDGLSGAFNLTAPHPVTNATFSRVLGRVLHRPAWLPVPAPALRLLFGQMATVLLDGQRAVPRRLETHGFTFRFPRVEGALRDLLE